ncbi:Acetoacetyl-CoA reductase [Cupriavidus necator]|uniref:Acetoacetyl-CoA reductase n=1 Tax=Cupriavidus necator (strain ATCC 17699 / DSM 428 / KCTC 22496 / NCIMB 10442 / H16 / Stanier 337) TaxID=381666 RepID=Q0KA69_CUPNH|nr:MULTISPECIES: acetoacetyl-CoA reductase [Cupriavidus]UEP67409.1 PhaB2 [Expression vector p2BBAD-phaB2-phaC2]EON20823.1 acetoacetyl-CoA reductase [Cupriavidus sp. GA3-3]QCC00935.1 acetoacetyl-CoA reductase [Cupriavidus necator H16]QQB76237.1 acetoacetyl-CoA reductase [Cupriavidus necator]WKA39302.1 acetoacetyl-CoA reductase [Cupriavidus necator]
MAGQRIALVTGGMGGLGEAIAVRLLADGARVVVTHSVHNDHVAQWLGTQRSAGREFTAFPVDVTDFASCQRCVSQVRSELGDVDILINNAGVTRDRTLRKMDKADWDFVLRTDLDSLFHMTRPLVEPMLARGWGRIVNISSVNASRGAFGQTNYAAAKAGVHGFTKALALELARKGITVNTVSPGYLDTHMVTDMPAEILERDVLPTIPVGRLGKPAEVAALISYLCSDDGAFVTGANFAINGGQHLQ